jgi:hypothetical protein
VHRLGLIGVEEFIPAVSAPTNLEPLLSDICSAMGANGIASAVNIALSTNVGSGLDYVALLSELEADSSLPEAVETNSPGIVATLLAERDTASREKVRTRTKGPLGCPPENGASWTSLPRE